MSQALLIAKGKGQTNAIQAILIQTWGLTMRKLNIQGFGQE